MDESRPGDARFDPERDAWILTSYADVSAALREALLVAWGADSDGHAAGIPVREAGALDLAPSRVAAWRPELQSHAVRLVRELPAGRPVDLVRGFAAPWSLDLAVMVTGAAPADAHALAGEARAVFLAAARATDGAPDPQARAAAAALARGLPGGAGSLGVQSFVALSQTLPCFLASAWLALLRHPAEVGALRGEPGLMPQALEELLRFAGPARAVFRRAAGPITIGRANMRTGDRVTLMLSTANRDPAQFPEPSQLHLGRPTGGHLAFGRGPHSCLGAQLIRLAAAVATEALLGGTASLELAGEVDWIGGYAIYAPASLPAVLWR